MVDSRSVVLCNSCYYYFKNNYSVVETDKDVGLISELTFDYDPIKVED